MSRFISFIEVYAIYKRWVINNPAIVTHVETVATWLSYIIAGKINKSHIVAELIYLLWNLLVSFNDWLIREAYGNDESYCGLREQIKLLLTIIHHTEVLVELLVKHRWGNKGKWTVVTLLQLFKCSLALILLYKFNEVLIAHPPIPILDRKRFIEWKVMNLNTNAFFMPQRYGRLVHQMECAPSVNSVNWELIIFQHDLVNSDVETKDLVYAETLHILKPLIHLVAMRAFGTTAWKPWLVALGIDVASMTLFNKHKNLLLYEQRLELIRRQLSIMLYLLRSPMYNGCFKNIIEYVFTSVCKNVPVISICMPLIYYPIEYFNYLQDTYFYMWSS